jgi:hypothetical protein
LDARAKKIFAVQFSPEPVNTTAQIDVRRCSD